jgi:prephenate dehydrogenase
VNPARLRCVVVGGAGSVGSLFADHLVRWGAEVCVIDVAEPPQHAAGIGPRYEHADLLVPSPQLAAELSRTDVVVLALPESVACDAVEGVVGALRPGALVVDTLSVKGRFVQAVRAAPPSIEVMSLNPMFAPSLGFEGRPVAAILIHDGPRAQEFLRLIELWGGRVVRMTADTHDRLAAATQALTHATVLGFGLALAGLKVDISELSAVAPPPHATMLALLARIVSSTPQVYWDVQAANDQAPLAREALADGLRRLTGLVDHGREDSWAAAFDELRDVLGTDLEHYRDLCARIFENGAQSHNPRGTT